MTLRTVVILALIVMIYAPMTAVRLSVWYSDFTLWESALRITPNRPRVILNLGVADARIGRVTEAMMLWQQAIRAAEQPRHSPYAKAFTQAAAWSNIGFVELIHGDLQGADRIADQVLETQPLFPEAHRLKAMTMLQSHACADAKPHLDAAIVSTGFRREYVKLCAELHSSF